MSEYPEIYEMDLHDEISIYTGVVVTRVPGGWLYRIETRDDCGAWRISMSFVPFDNEFQKEKSPQDVNQEG